MRLVLRGAIKTVCALPLLICTQVAIAIPIPADLGPGDQFHFAFSTLDTIHGQRTLAFYDEFVNQQALLSGSLTESIDTQWKALLSTTSVDAKDHVPIGDHTPIYLLDGTLVATGALDLWDGSP